MIAYMVNLNNFEPDAGSTIIPLHVQVVERDRVYFSDPERGMAYMPKCTHNYIIFATREEAKDWFEKSLDIRLGLLNKQIEVIGKLYKHLEEI
jgi:hypothetical protein